jgi:CYTH domain-containing protein
MAKEIERKFLVVGDSWKTGIKVQNIKQGYLSTENERVVRVRLIDDKAYLTIKGINVGIARVEFEYEIPAKEAEQILLNLCEKPVIEKLRYTIKYIDHLWTVDEFKAENEGLILAEIELKSEQEYFEKPNWLGKEVSSDLRYYNSYLIKHPFKSW